MFPRLLHEQMTVLKLSQQSPVSKGLKEKEMVVHSRLNAPPKLYTANNFTNDEINQSITLLIND